VRIVERVLELLQQLRKD